MKNHLRLPSLLLFSLIFWFVSYAVPAEPQASSDNKSSQEQGKPDAAAMPGSDLKPTASDEGQLATVNNAKIPAYAKVYVAPMAGGFENYIIAGFRNKKVPLTVVVDRAKAEYEISGVSESDRRIEVKKRGSDAVLRNRPA